MIGLGGVKSICISSGVGVLARSSDTVIYIEECWVLKDAEEGGALDSEEQEDDVEEEDEVDVSVVAEIIDSGSEVSRCCRRFSSMLSLSVTAGWSTDSCAGGGLSTSICIGLFLWFFGCVLVDVDDEDEDEEDCAVSSGGGDCC